MEEPWMGARVALSTAAHVNGGGPDVQCCSPDDHRCITICLRCCLMEMDVAVSTALLPDEGECCCVNGIAAPADRTGATGSVPAASPSAFINRVGFSRSLLRPHRRHGSGGCCYHAAVPLLAVDQRRCLAKLSVSAGTDRKVATTRHCLPRSSASLEGNRMGFYSHGSTCVGEEGSCPALPLAVDRRQSIPTVAKDATIRPTPAVPPSHQISASGGQRRIFLR